MNFWGAALALVVLASGVACSTRSATPLREVLPREVDASAAGDAVEFALDEYPRLARLANLDQQGRLTSDWRAEFADSVQRCNGINPRLAQQETGETDDARRRRHLVRAGCLVLVEHRENAGAIDRVLALWELALSPESSALPPMEERR